MRYREFTIANQDKLVLVNSPVYKGVGVYTGINYWDNTIYVRVNTKYYELNYLYILKFLPKGKMTGVLYG